MSNECCCCGGRCGGQKPVELNRRDFMEKLALGTAALALAGGLAVKCRSRGRGLPNASEALGRANLPDDAAAGLSREEPGSGRHAHRRHRHRQHLARRRGQTGRLANLQQPQRAANPRQLFRRSRAAAPRARRSPACCRPRPKDRCGRWSRSSYEGGYPIARLTFHDPELPVQVSLEALNPMIPLDAANSSIPCAIFRLTAKNAGADAGRGDPLRHAAKRGRQRRGRRHPGRATRPATAETATASSAKNGWTAVAMDKSADPVASGPVKVRTAGGQEVARPGAVLAGPDCRA